ncbi:kinase-like domain-containing protein [Polychytrium aggregatum]|uniref:kinase-like domain-containing protein n=1 Tax=Polychytrium aggregatum TaxID=110093 RepID=UPI0022FF2404|nr:kinase-like domain-containing protein [Polychytrium aggregatum]KAI9205393.1 kinase-like domain-containing protein [Polychytrium aggregatum]
MSPWPTSHRPSSKLLLYSSIGIVSAGLVLGCIGYVGAQPERFPRASRILRFWGQMLPIFLDYKLTQFQVRSQEPEEQEQAFEALHSRYARQVKDLMVELGGLYIKVGQVGAMRADFVPETYRRELQSLLDQVPPLPGPKARQIVEQALGRKIASVFQEFEDTALGAASIGQVHRAKLHDGREVVVKIKYPSSFEHFADDVATVKQFVVLAQPDQEPVMDELGRQFLSEFHFEREAQALQRVRKNLMPFFRNIVVPEPVLEYCNQDVIVMEYIPGVKLLDGIMHDYERQARRAGFSLQYLQEHAGSLTRLEMLQLWAAWGLGHISDTVQMAGALVHNTVLSPVTGHTLPYPQPSVDQERLYKTLLRVHGHEIFVDRFFQGDPHLGNILLTPEGKLGLIDYGQVKSLSEHDIAVLAQLFVFIADHKKDEAVQLAKQVGFETEKNDPYVLYQTMVVALDRDDTATCEGMNPQQYMERLSKLDKTRSIPEQFVMAVRTAILLRAVGYLMGYRSVSLAQEWRPFAEHALRQYGHLLEHE